MSMMKLGRIQTQSLLAMVSGQILWATHFTLLYVLMSVGCAVTLAEARIGELYLINVVLVLVTVPLLLLIVLLGWAVWRYTVIELQAPKAMHEQEWVRQRLMARAAVLLHAISALAVLWVTLPVLVSPPCY